LDLPAGYSDVKLEARFSRIRTEETNLGNLVADLCRTEFGTEFALTNGGNLRANHVFEEGYLKWKFMTQILPMTDKVLMIEVTGKIILDLMENGVSLWPSLDGRWPIVSGFKFSFDPSKPPGNRIVSLKKDNGEDIKPD
jgi:5'-nucleotidase